MILWYVQLQKKQRREPLYCKRWSAKWGCYIDTFRNEMVDGDIVTIREHIHSHPGSGKQQKNDASNSQLHRT